MRVGFNPNKDKQKEASVYIHQVVIPVYIPNNEGYFRDGLKILKLCLSSLLKTIHHKTFVTIVNNGSSEEVISYLNDLFQKGEIHELIATENIGKLNAILKGVAGNNIALVTISDADVMFLPNWQHETSKIFAQVPKAGVVGIVPQFKMYEANCANIIYDNIFNKKMRFLPVQNANALMKFYDSIGWDRDYNQDYLKYNLGLEVDADLNVLIGSGHMVATYRRDMFENLKSYIGYKLGGISEAYLDQLPLKSGYWRLTTSDNYAYHLGNIYEDWMCTASNNETSNKIVLPHFKYNKSVSRLNYFLKNKLVIKCISIPFLNRLFLKWKGLPKDMIKKY